MPSKKDLAFQADVLERLHKLEDANTALRRDASSFSLTTSTRLTSLEDSGVHEARRAVGEREAFAEMQERLLSLETSGDAVKYMWESMPNMMAELRKAHNDLFHAVESIRGAVSEIKTQEQRMEREEQRTFDEERLFAVNAVKETVAQTQQQMRDINLMLTDATKTLLPPPQGAQVCKHCRYHWWEDARCSGRGYREPHEHFPRDDRRRTKLRCYKCDEVWEPIQYMFTGEGRRYYHGIS
jgi:hypothetical protein